MLDRYGRGIRERIAFAPWISEEMFRRLASDDLIRAAERAIDFYQPLKNVARQRRLIRLSPEQITLGPGEQLFGRVVLALPGRNIIWADIAFPTGESYSRSEFIRRLASAVGDQAFPGDPKISSRVEQAIVGVSWGIQKYIPL